MDNLQTSMMSSGTQLNSHALNLICTNYEDSEEDEIYAGSTCETTDKLNCNSELSSLPVPQVLKSLYCSSSSPKDSSEDHQGRVRSFPHTRGNWASYAYIKCIQSEDIEKLLESFAQKIILIQKEFPDKEVFFLNLDLLHLSLTRTQIFRYHWIQPFLDSLTDKLKATDEIEITFNGLDVYVNEEGTRTFIGIEVLPTKQILDLVALCDESLHEFSLQPYYKTPSFHISVAWMLGDEKKFITKYILPSLENVWKNDYSTSLNFRANAINFKTGNKDFVIGMKS